MPESRGCRGLLSSVRFRSSEKDDSQIGVPEGERGRKDSSSADR